MNDASSRNSYLDQVVVEQQQLEQNLKAKRALMPMSQAAAAPARMAVAERLAVRDTPAAAVEVRITGFWRWKTVIVPPNAYVVHTRRGRPEPVHMGLGVSFAFNPFTDAFLVVPGAMQTILINARCISKERQGVLVQSYVQWIVQDLGTAYKKLDFSDSEEPMRLVNLQLREQAEAAIKDKVSMMTVDEVLADKQPIIEELTARLRAVAEGGGSSDKGLGLRIVTVQIKEAVVSSQRLWENLQKPFRAEMAQRARLAEIESEETIRRRELEADRSKQTGALELARQLAEQRAQVEAETFDREQAEAVRRAKTEHETRLKAAALEKERLETEHALSTAKQSAAAAEAKQRVEAELAEKVARAKTELERVQLVAQGDEARQRVENAITPAALEARVVASLPVVLEKLPKPAELKTVAITGGDGALAGAVSQVAAVLSAVRGVASRE
jgi:hypothetical protein